MYLISQTFIFLALALIIGGAIGYALRSCMADTACDDVRDDLALVTSRYDALLERQNDVFIPQVLATEVMAQPVEEPTLAKMNVKDLEAALLKAAPGVSPKFRHGADDLTAIKGITPAIDAWLNANGITRLSQVGDFNAAELFWLVENLPNDGASVYRDHWVAQAVKLQGPSKTLA